MIKITNGKDIVSVSNSAFENIFKIQGYIPAEENINRTIKENEKSNEEKEVEEILSKPISSWNKSEVKFVASVKNIDTSKANNVSGAKEIVRNALGI